MENALYLVHTGKAIFQGEIGEKNAILIAVLVKSSVDFHRLALIPDNADIVLEASAYQGNVQEVYDKLRERGITVRSII